jgi:LysM repeat protein
MTTDHDLDEQLSDIARALVADAPDALDWDEVATTPRKRPGTRRWLAGAVAATVLVGVGGIVASRPGDEGSRGSGAPPDSGPTVTTVLIPGGPTTVRTEQTYVVVSGDFLAAIADAHCVTMEALAEYNSWSEGLDHALLPGEVIHIPPGACDPETVSLAEPMFPTAFPIINAPYTASTPDLSMLGDSPPTFHQVDVTHAYLGIRSGDAVQRGIVVTVGRNFDLLEPEGEEPVDVVALGQPARLWEESGDLGDRVVWGDDPYVEVIGVDALRFLALADESPFDVGVGDDGAATLTVGALPGGYDVIFGPQRFLSSSAAVKVVVRNESGRVEYSVWVSSDNQLMWNDVGEPLMQMDAGAGVTAWHLRGGLLIQVNDGTFAFVWVSEDNVDVSEDYVDREMLLLTDMAQHITWVSAAEWEDQLGVELPAWMSPPTTSP